jgi:hypothetical protein
MKRRLAILVPVLIALLALGAAFATHTAPNAHARGSGWTLNSSPPPYVDGVCPFRVDLTTLNNDEYVNTESEPDGTVVQHFTGSLKVAASNDVTGKTLDYNISGPGTITTSPDGSQFVDGGGVSLWPFPPAAQPQFNLPGLAYIQGHFTISFDPNGNVVGFTHEGATITDVCAALS